MIGIIGGTFDPIHYGHLRPALEIAEQFDLDEVRFIPSANPPHRWKPIASAEHRLNMVKLAVEGFPLFSVDDREYHRQGSSYTVDTLQSILDEEQTNLDEEQADEEQTNDESTTPSLLMMLGLDAFQSFTQWHDWQRILELTHIVVSTRPGYLLETKSLDKSDEWMQGRVVDSVSELKQKQAGCIFFSEVTALDISATNIRKQLLSGASSRFLMPEKVLDYIEEHDLYNATVSGK